MLGESSGAQPFLIHANDSDSIVCLQPPYITEAEKFKQKGVDAVYCLASNDAFVMSAFGRVYKAGHGSCFI